MLSLSVYLRLRRFAVLSVLGTQQIAHRLYGREGRHGNLDEDRRPVGHRAVPQARKLLCAQLAAAARLRRYETRRRVGVFREIEFFSIGFTHAAHYIYGVEVRGLLHQRHILR